MRIAAAIGFGNHRHALHLHGGQNAIGDAHAQHVAVLRRRDIEQSVIAPAEIIFGLRKGLVGRLLAQAGIGVERMFGALPFFLIDQLFANSFGASLRLQGCCVWTGGFECRCRCDGRSPHRCQASRGTPDIDAGGKTFEIAFLLAAHILAHQALRV